MRRRLRPCPSVQGRAWGRLEAGTETMGRATPGDKRDLLSKGNFLPEISCALASRILDWTTGAHLSAYSGAARIAALFRPKHTRCIELPGRNN